MPRNSFGLTGLGAASKLFFLASQTARQRWPRESCRASRRIVRDTTDARMTRTSAIYRFFCAFGFLLSLGIVSFLPAQSSPTPTRELLLNGLPVLYWQRPGDANLFMKLRLNSGAAFDLTGKAGTMALLADALFPDPATREYVSGRVGRPPGSYDHLRFNRCDDFRKSLAGRANGRITPKRDSRSELIRR